MHARSRHTYPGMLDVQTDPTLLPTTFGSHVVLEFDDLRHRTERVTEQETRDASQSVGAGVSFTEIQALDFEDGVVEMGHDGPARLAVSERRVRRPARTRHPARPRPGRRRRPVLRRLRGHRRTGTLLEIGNHQPRRLRPRSRRMGGRVEHHGRRPALVPRGRPPHGRLPCGGERAGHDHRDV
ncbi:hypothetical protein GCM10010320_67420 [Streptomyces caelestis]|nr:hypothetical protein GCM10010320_67420 [Streptomyces caelestis]